MPEDIIDVSTEHFPCVAFTDKTAIRVKAEAQLLQDVVASEGWALARDAWNGIGQYLHNEQLTALPERLFDIQAELRAIGLPDRIVRDVSQDAARAEKWQRDGNAPRALEPRPFGSDEEATAAIERARAVKELVAKPGWKLMMRKLVAAAYGARLLLDWCEPKLAKQIQAMIRAYYRPVKKLQEFLDRGVDAEVYFTELQKEQKGRPRNG